MTENVVPLFGHADPRFGELTAALFDVVNERGKSLPFVAVLGGLRMVEHCIIQNQINAMAP